MDNCTSGPCGWHKLQITPSAIKIYPEIHIVGLIYKLLPKVKLR
jgi:hypothetical protein